MPEVNQRSIVIEILDEVLEQGRPLHMVLGRKLSENQSLGKQERAFITQVAKGTIQRLVQVDEVINQFAKKPGLKKLKPAIRCILRASIYQILFLDAVPDSAVCNEAVKLAKKKGYSGLAGFVNGVLRSVSRSKADMAWSTEAVKYSLPQWIYDQWKEAYGEDVAQQIAQSLLDDHPTYIRVNTEKIAPEAFVETLINQNIKINQNTEISYALAISGYDHIAAIPGFEEGLFYVQDLSSMQVAHSANIKEGDYIIDVCAAPGGKSLHAAALLCGSGMVDSRDLTLQKVKLIEENIARTGATNIKVKAWDATVLDETAIKRADIVFCDAPCSGLGIIGKKPDIKAHMSRPQQLELAELQRQILATACQYVKPSGTLMYSTCTICRDENEDNVAWFVENNTDFALDFQRQILPTEGCDGFFLARLVRKN